MQINSIIKRPILALDFGTANCLIIKNRVGIILNEPTVVSISSKTKKIIATGSEAKKMLGKENSKVLARRPLQNGGISNYQLAYLLLETFMNSVLGRFKFAYPDVIISVPSKINSLEERALIKALDKYGVNKKVLFPEALAASIGAGLPVEKASGSMIINIGGGTAEIAVVSLDGIVTSASNVGAGDKIDEKIIEVLRKSFDLEIGVQKAEEIKLKIADAMGHSKLDFVEVSGKSSNSKTNKTVRVYSKDIYPAIREVLDEIIEVAKDVINETSAELISDIMENGIALSGGTANIKNIEILFTKSLGIPCYVVDDPLTSVVKGLSRVVNKGFV